jgi:hypothetical protein
MILGTSFFPIESPVQWFEITERRIEKKRKKRPVKGIKMAFRRIIND